MSQPTYCLRTEVSAKSRIVVCREDDRHEVCEVDTPEKAARLTKLLNEGLPEHEALAPFDDAYAQYWSAYHTVRDSSNPQIGWVIYDRQGVAIANRPNESTAEAYAKELDDSTEEPAKATATEDTLKLASALLRLVEASQLATCKKVLFRLDCKAGSLLAPSWCGIVVGHPSKRDLITRSSRDLNEVLDQVIEHLNSLT